MKVWVVTTTGEFGAEIKGVMPTAEKAVALMTGPFDTAVEMELGEDYTECRKFVVMTRDNPVPRMINFEDILGAAAKAN